MRRPAVPCRRRRPGTSSFSRPCSSHRNRWRASLQPALTPTLIQATLPAAGAALLRSAGGPGAGHWTLLPSHPAFLLQDSLFMAAARSRLGLPVGLPGTCHSVAASGQASARLLDHAEQHARTHARRGCGATDATTPSAIGSRAGRRPTGAPSPSNSIHPLGQARRGGLVVVLGVSTPLHLLRLSIASLHWIPASCVQGCRLS